MKLKKYRGRVLFGVLSFFGIIVFFVPILKGQIPLLFLINAVKSRWADASQVIVLFFGFTLLVSVLLGRGAKVKFFRRRHEKDHLIEIIFYFLVFLFELIIFLDIDCSFLRDENIREEVFGVAYSVMITIIISGSLVVFIIKSGIVEFLSYLIEPLMQKLFCLPGSAAIDCLSSFVSSASVGIYITSGFYEDSRYTEREACTVATCFSVMSLGFMFVLTEMAGIPQLAIPVIVTSFIVMVMLAIICVRIPPLSEKREIYFNGKYKEEKCEKENISIKKRFLFSLTEAEKRAGLFQIKYIFNYFLDSVLFAQKTVATLIPPMVIVMGVARYTELFDWLGKIVVPVLKIMQLPNASQIAPATIIGIAEVTLPVISLIGIEIETKSIFFIVVLSIVQVIYFSESANAILSSSIPLKAIELIKIFFVRTLIAFPIVAIATHLVIGILC